MADSIDSLVKGATNIPAQDVKPNAGTSPIQDTSNKGAGGDPTNNAPNSPSMVYLNLLILEASMRAQFLELRARKRHHTFFLIILTLWITFFGYQLFLAPREDGRGVGGSIYWALEGAQKVCFMGGIITAILIWAVGIWERGIRWPRRWFVISNRGLRAFNCKLVLVRRSWYAEALSTVGFFLTYGLFSHTASSSYRHVDPFLLREVEKELQLTSDNHPTLVLPPEDEERGGHEEDLAPGGDYVKLLLLAKPFSPTFRENWELYRTEYWERENERRALLRQKVQEHDKKLLRQQYGWTWWLPGRQVRPVAAAPTTEQGKHGQHHHPPHHRHSASHSGSIVLDRERKRRSSSVRRGSTSSSRSPTPAGIIADAEDAHTMTATTTTTTRKVSGSGPSTGPGAQEKRRKKQGSVSSRSKRPGTESRSVTPEFTSPLAKESATISESERDGDGRRVLRSTGAKSKSSTPPVD